VVSQVATLEHYVHEGGIVLGAFIDDRFVGVGVVVPHLRPGISQLAFLHVTADSRDGGVGRRLCEALEEIARAEGDTEMVVSATPSEHTVRFYLARGLRPMAEPLPELFALEPEDIHLSKLL
jgi:GNAT superfamily N-acetyltransferase